MTDHGLSFWYFNFDANLFLLHTCHVSFIGIRRSWVFSYHAYYVVGTPFFFTTAESYF